MIVNQLADYITELKLGNGTSVLIFANIASYLPASVGSAFVQADKSGSTGIVVYMIAFLLTTFGIVCVQVRPGTLYVRCARQCQTCRCTLTLELRGPAP